MTNDSGILKSIYVSIGPQDDIETSALQLKIAFRYRQAIDELIFAAVTCCLDFFSAILLSQYSNSPAKCHYIAVKHIFRYLHLSLNNGLYFWPIYPDYSLPTAFLPTLHHNNHYVNLPSTLPFEPTSFADADSAANVQTRRSVSGSAIFLAGAPITYKCKLKHTVTLSSTESELYAACEATKNIKYIRSMMQYLGFELTTPTLIHEDNAATIAVSNN